MTPNPFGHIQHEHTRQIKSYHRCNLRSNILFQNIMIQSNIIDINMYHTKYANQYETDIFSRGDRIHIFQSFNFLDFQDNGNRICTKG